MNSLQQIPTGIKGLDTLLNGGIPRGWVVVISGGAGTGKTTLSTEFLVRGVSEYDEVGLFVTFNEPKTTLLQTMGKYWNIEDFCNEKKIFILDFSAATLDVLEKSVEVGRSTLEIMIENIHSTIDLYNAKRVVIDPLNALSLLFRDQFEVRRELHKLFGMLSRTDTITFGTLELAKAGTEILEFTLAEFLANGIIRINYIREALVKTRGIEVIKMRGVKHSNKLVPMEISNQGVIVHTKTEVFRKSEGFQF